MNGSSFSYLTKEGFRNIRVNRLMSVSSISVLMSCMIMIGLAFVALTNMQSVAHGIEEKNVIIAYMPVDATQEQIDALGEDIRALSNIRAVVSVTKEEALEQQKQQYGLSDAFWAGLDENPLPHSYRVTVDDLDKFGETLTQIKSLDNIEEVRDNKDFAEKLFSIRTAIYYVSLGMIAMLLLVSFFIISSTIRITMLNRKREISIMKSVGATSSFIRWPFVIEGMMIGILSGILSFLAVWGLYTLVCNTLADVFTRIHFTPVQFFSFAWKMLGAFLAGGVVVGGLGSALSVGKYLKEQSYDVSEDDSEEQNF